MERIRKPIIAILLFVGLLLPIACSTAPGRDTEGYRGRPPDYQTEQNFEREKQHASNPGT